MGIFDRRFCVAASSGAAGFRRDLSHEAIKAGFCSGAYLRLYIEFVLYLLPFAELLRQKGLSAVTRNYQVPGRPGPVLGFWARKVST